MIVELTVASRKGRKGNYFGAESRASFPMVGRALLIAARERDNEQETPHLASVPVKTHKRAPTNPSTILTLFHLLELLFCSPPVPTLPCAHHLLCP